MTSFNSQNNGLCTDEFLWTGGTGFKRIHAWKNHERAHGCERFPCPECHKSFDMKANLMVHLQTHGEVKQSYQCGECDRKYFSKSGRNAHMKTKHPVTKPVPKLEPE